MFRSMIPPRRWPVAALPALATLLAACGGGGSDNAAMQADAATRDAHTAVVAAAALPTTIYASPNGDDTWPGTYSQPVKTVVQAQKLAQATIAAMKGGQQARASVNVVLQDGTYVLTEALKFADVDSGVSGYPVVYQAEHAGKALISGGLKLVAAPPGSAMTFLLPAQAPTIDWSAAQQLFVNDHRATLARAPKDGYWFVDQGKVLDGETTGPKRAFTTTPHAQAFIDGLSPESKARAVVNLYQSWTTSRHHLVTPAAKPNTVQIQPDAYWAFGSFQGVNQRFYVENVIEALDSPGEWFGDSQGIRYLPQQNETPTSAVLPILDQLVVVGKDAPVAYLEFRDLVFEHTRLETPAGGIVDKQAAWLIPAAFDVKNASNVKVKGCTFTHLGGYALWFNQGTTSSEASGNTITDAGAGGIRSGMAQADTTTKSNKILNNAVVDIGHIMPGAVGIWVGRTYDTIVSQNLVANTTYTGISVGWDWDSVTTATSGYNAITNNLLFNIGQGNLGDMGGIYTVGTTAIGPNNATTTISGNVIREVRGYPGYGPGAWGLYGDQLTSNVLASNNVVVGTDNGGQFLNVLATADTASGNLFAWGDLGELLVNATASNALTETGNVFVPKLVQPFGNHASAPVTAYSGNWVSSTAAPSPVSLTQCGGGCTTSSTTVATTTAPRGVQLSGDPSTVLSTLQGVIGAAGPSSPLVKTLQVASVPPTVQLAPPWPYTMDIASVKPGDRPSYLITYSDKAAPESIAVQSWPSTPKGSINPGQCLEMKETTAQYANEYDPFFYVRLNHTTGTSTAKFWVWVDATTDVRHEWRDAAGHVGPTLRIQAGGVKVNGGPDYVAKVVVGNWNLITVTAPVNDADTSVQHPWTLQVTPNGATQPTTITVPSTKGAMASFDQMYFISDATPPMVNSQPTTALTCLPDVTVDNTVYHQQ